MHQAKAGIDGHAADRAAQGGPVGLSVTHILDGPIELNDDFIELLMLTTGWAEAELSCAFCSKGNARNVEKPMHWNVNPRRVVT